MIVQVRCRVGDPFRAASRGSQSPQTTRPPGPLLDYSNIAKEKSGRFPEGPLLLERDEGFFMIASGTEQRRSSTFFIDKGTSSFYFEYKRDNVEQGRQGGYDISRWPTQRLTWLERETVVT